MSYVKKTLMSNEKLIFYSKPHWAVFTWPTLWLIAGLLLILFNFDYLDFNGAVILGIPMHIFFGITILGIALFQGFLIYIFYISSEYAITDKRILMKVGLIQRRSLEIFTAKIESIYVDQSITGRIFNFGSIIIGGIGGSKDVFNYVPEPLQFRQLVQDQIGSVPK